MLIGQCDLDGIQILTLDILHQRHLHHTLVFHRADIGGECLQTCFLRCSPTTFTCDDLVFAVRHLAQGDRGDDTHLTDTVSQLLHRLLVEFSTRLVGVGHNLMDVDLIEVRRPLRMYVAGVDQCIEPPAVSYLVEATS